MQPVHCTAAPPFNRRSDAPQPLGSRLVSHRAVLPGCGRRTGLQITCKQDVGFGAAAAVQTALPRCQQALADIWMKPESTGARRAYQAAPDSISAGPMGQLRYL